MAENIYDELKKKYTEYHPNVKHSRDIRVGRLGERNVRSKYIDEIHQNLKVLHNIHKNKSAVVFGAGPSLLSYSEIDDGTSIRVSCNRQIFREEILPFHLYINVDGGSGGKHSYVEDFKEEIDSYQPLYAKFYCVHWNVLYEAYVEAGAIPFMVTTTKYFRIPFNRDNGTEHSTYIEDPNLAHLSEFSSDLSKTPPALNSNVGQVIMQFLLYMGFSKIYLVGFDASGGGRWNHETAYWRRSDYAQNVAQWPRRWYFFRKWQKESYPNVKIINVNPVGLKGMMDEDIYT